MPERTSCDIPVEDKTKICINLYPMRLEMVYRGILVKEAMLDLPAPEGWDEWDRDSRLQWLKKEYGIVRSGEAHIDSVVPQPRFSIRASIV